MYGCFRDGRHLAHPILFYKARGVPRIESGASFDAEQNLAMENVDLRSHLEPWFPKAHSCCSERNEGLNVQASRPRVFKTIAYRLILFIFLRGPKLIKYDEICVRDLHNSGCFGIC